MFHELARPCMHVFSKSTDEAGIYGRQSRPATFQLDLWKVYHV